MKFLANLPYYAFVGCVGVVSLISVAVAPYFDLMPGIGWCILATVTLVFYLSTFEAPHVECEWAGWILMVGSTITVLSGTDPVNIIAWILSPLAIAFTIAMYYSPAFRQKANAFLFRKAKPSPKATNSAQTELSSATASEAASSEQAA